MAASEHLNGVQFYPQQHGDSLALSSEMGLIQDTPRKPPRDWSQISAERVPLSQITHTTQGTVTRQHVERYLKDPGEPVNLIRRDDEGYQIHEGNHRVAAARVRGDQDIEARVYR